MPSPHLLCVGYDRILLETRSAVLRQAGYVVHETAVLATALSQVASDSIDGLLICNSIPSREQERFIRQIINKRRLLPIICIHNNPYEQSLPGCLGAENDPAALLAVLRKTFGSGTENLPSQAAAEEQ